jgi:phosphoribosylglycinamide formyltransferase 1
MSVRIAILASGSGTNAQALLDASARGDLEGGEVAVVVSDRPDGMVLERARKSGVEGLTLEKSGFSDREAYGKALVDELRSRDVELVCLAGFMLILPAAFIQAFPNRVLNTHPALLPAFPGAHPVRDTLEWGAKVTGATIHFADEETDHGPIILQEAVPVLPEDDEQSLQDRIKQVEHRLYPEAVRAVAGDRVQLVGRTVVIANVREGLPVSNGDTERAAR